VKFCEEVEVEIHAFLTSALDGVGSQLHAISLVKGLHYTLSKLRRGLQFSLETLEEAVCTVVCS